MNKLTEAEFLDFYSKTYGEKTDKLGQTISHTFTGEELFEFANDAINYKKYKLAEQEIHYPKAWMTEMGYDKQIEKPKRYYIHIFGVDLFCLCLYENSGFFTLFGRGLNWKPKGALLFSDRNGKSIVIGNWRIKYFP